MDRNKAAADARRRKAVQPSPIRAELLRTWRTTGDRTDTTWSADPTGWWRNAGVLSELGPTLAGPFEESAPSVVIATQSRGTPLGALVAVHLGVGLVEVRKDDGPTAASDEWRFRTTPPDYRDRHLKLGFPRRLLEGGERVLFVDDWIDTGGQALAVRGLVDDSGATWLGAAVIVDDRQTHDSAEIWASARFCTAGTSGPSPNSPQVAPVGRRPTCSAPFPRRSGQPAKCQ